MADERDQRIRERAHAIWEREGRPFGRDEEHWRQAMEDIDRESADGGATGARMTPSSGAATDASDIAQVSRRRRAKPAEPAPVAGDDQPKGRRRKATEAENVGASSTAAPDAAAVPKRKRQAARSEGTKEDGAPPAQAKAPRRRTSGDAGAGDPQPAAAGTEPARGRRRTAASEGSKEDGAPPSGTGTATAAEAERSPDERTTT